MLNDCGPAPGGEPERFTVLVIEDNPVNQAVATKMLASEEYEVILAENGLKGVDLFERARPSIVLMDISMPVMDGLEATRRIRQYEMEKRLVRTPIIATTAHALDESRRKCSEVGMDDFMAKPLRKSALDEMVKRWITEAVEWEADVA